MGFAGVLCNIAECLLCDTVQACCHVEGKLSRWAGENDVLLDQPFIKDDSKTVREVIAEVNARTGENITVGRFARFIVGEQPSA